MKTKELRLLIREELAKEIENSSLITPINEKLDPVGKEDDDIDNDGDVDKTDKYLLNRRKAIKKAVDKQDVKEALNPEVSKTVNNLIKAMAKRYDYSEQDAVFAIMAALKQRDFDGVNEEMDPQRPKDKEFDLAQQLSKLTPEDREKLAMIQQMISKEKMEEGEGSTLKLSAKDMEKLHKDGKLVIDDHTILYATGKPKVDETVDVENIDKFLPKINTKAEYMELLPKILNLDVPGVTPSMKKIALRDYVKSNKVNEDVDLGHVDNEPHMLKSDLYRIGKYAMELYKILDGFDDGETEFDFPHWWQSKIIKARHMLTSAKHYLDFELKEPEITAMVRVAGEEEIIDEELNEIDIHALPPYVGSGMSRMEAAKAVLKDEGKSPEEIKAIIDKAMFTPEFDKLVARYKDSR